LAFQIPITPNLGAEACIFLQAKPRVKKSSIALRLSLWYLTIFLLGAFALRAGMFDMLQTDLLDIADSGLHGRAVGLERWLESRKDLSTAELQAQLNEKYEVEHAQDYLQISDPHGNVIYRSQLYSEQGLPSITPDEMDRPIYENCKVGSDHFRIASEQIEVSGRSYIFTIARPMNQEFDTLFGVRKRLLRVSALVLMVAAAGGYWMSRRAVAQQPGTT
jgi:hypothetical protein